MNLLLGGSTILEHLCWLEKVSTEIIGRKTLGVPIVQLIMKAGANNQGLDVYSRRMGL